MAEAKFSTTRKHVVAPGQIVRVELDLYDGSERLTLALKTIPGARLEWLDNKTFLYHCPQTAFPRDGFMLRKADWTYDRLNIEIDVDYKQSAEQQARERNPGGGGVDPRVAILEAKLAQIAKIAGG